MKQRYLYQPEPEHDGVPQAFRAGYDQRPVHLDLPHAVAVYALKIAAWLTGTLSKETTALARLQLAWRMKALRSLAGPSLFSDWLGPPLSQE